MKITVKVHARARRNRLSSSDAEYKLEVTAPPVDGQANEAVIEFFARGLRLPRSAVRIVTGEHARRKVVEIEGATEDRISSLL
jgi:uncharacterized protein (TIGR00251 family)